MKFFITTPIYYVNDLPHIGHAYTTVAADVLARYHRKKGEKVFLLTGTDEHGAKVAKAAQEQNKTPKQFADEISAQFEKSWKDLNIQYDYFVRTTDPEHEKYVQNFLNDLFKKGVIYPGIYEGLYCTGCEAYKTQAELVEGLCPDHNSPPEIVKEKVYYFGLSKYREELTEIIEKNQLLVEPESRKKEVLNFIKAGLKDVAISRTQVEWGIKLPWQPEQTIYVWIDALLNYLSAGYRYWPVDLHLIGKDILRFHAIIWPAMLLAMDLPLPKKIYVHGYLTVEGKKMSKTLGNVISVDLLIKQFGVDGARYLILSSLPYGLDGDVSESFFTRKYNADLANELGNLVQRVVTLASREKIEFTAKEKGDLPKDLIEKLDKCDFVGALGEIWKKVKAENQKIDREKLWSQKGEKLEKLLKEHLQIISEIANDLEIFMPQIAEDITNQIKTLKPQVLFPKIK
jgi:methionyl-tRNA synthetase